MTVLPFALGDARCTQKFRHSAKSEGSSFLEADPSSIHRNTDWQTVETADEIEVHRLDTYCTSKAIAGIDFLKIDVQGWEMQVLRGAEGLFELGGIRVILLEVVFEPLYVGQSRPVELFEFLDARGFRLVDLYNPSRRPNGLLEWCDALFVRDAL